MAKNLTAKIYMVGSTAGVEVEIKDKEKFLEELKKLSSENDFYIHSDDDGEIAINTSLIQAIEFSDDTPKKLIQKIKPDFLIKGGDYKKKDIVGNDIVSSYGGETIIIPLIDGLSSTNTINKINK